MVSRRLSGRKKKVKPSIAAEDLPKSGNVYIKLTCIECNREFEIQTSNPTLYTEEYRKNYKCLVCRAPRI